MPLDAVRAFSQAAVSAIRAAGAKNVILIESNGWAGAWTWHENGAGVLTSINDPENNLIFEVHQYLDGNGSGTSGSCVSGTVGAERIGGATKKARELGVKLFLGEFGGGNNPTCEQAVTGMLRHMQDNKDVWAGWTWWAAGPWWGEYYFTIEPKSGADRPQLSWLSRYLE